MPLKLSLLVSKFHCTVIGYVPPNSLRHVQHYHVSHQYRIVILVILCGRGSASNRPVSVKGAVGAAAILQVLANQAAEVANAAANDAAAVSSAHSIILEKHCAMFLQRAFGINPDGTAVDQAVVPNHLKKYKSVKTVEQYNNMVWCLTYWEEDEYLATAPEDDMEALIIYRFRRQHTPIPFGALLSKSGSGW